MAGGREGASALQQLEVIADMFMRNRLQAMQMTIEKIKAEGAVKATEADRDVALAELDIRKSAMQTQEARSRREENRQRRAFELNSRLAIRQDAREGKRLRMAEEAQRRELENDREADALRHMQMTNELLDLHIKQLETNEAMKRSYAANVENAYGAVERTLFVTQDDGQGGYVYLGPDKSLLGFLEEADRVGAGGIFKARYGEDVEKVKKLMKDPVGNRVQLDPIIQRMRADLRSGLSTAMLNRADGGAISIADVFNEASFGEVGKKIQSRIKSGDFRSESRVANFQSFWNSTLWGQTDNSPLKSMIKAESEYRESTPKLDSNGNKLRHGIIGLGSLLRSDKLGSPDFVDEMTNLSSLLEAEERFGPLNIPDEDWANPEDVIKKVYKEAGGMASGKYMNVISQRANRVVQTTGKGYVKAFRGLEKGANAVGRGISSVGAGSLALSGLTVGAINTAGHGVDNVLGDIGSSFAQVPGAFKSAASELANLDASIKIPVNESDPIVDYLEEQMRLSRENQKYLRAANDSLNTVIDAKNKRR